MKSPVLAARVLVLALAAAVAPALAGCGTTPGERSSGDGALMDRQVRSFHVVYSEHTGKVGFMKVFDVVEGGGPPYQWKYVYDLQWNELGFIDQFGTAYQNKPYSPFEQSAQPRPIRVVRLPSDSAQRNAMRMLGIDPAYDDVTFPLATDADIRGVQAQ